MEESLFFLGKAVVLWALTVFTFQKSIWSSCAHTVYVTWTNFISNCCLTNVVIRKSSLITPHCVDLSINSCRGWRGDAAVERTLFRFLAVHLQPLQRTLFRFLPPTSGSSQGLVILHPGNLTPSPGLQGPHVHLMHICTFISTHIVAK